MSFKIRWDQWRFPEGVAFPAGIENWPSWLVEAIYTFAATETPADGDVAEFIDESPPFVKLIATEPYLKTAKYVVGLWPDDRDEREETLVVSEVEKA